MIKESLNWTYLSNPDYIVTEEDLTELSRELTPHTKTERIINFVARIKLFDNNITRAKWLRITSNKTNIDMKELLGGQKMSKAFGMFDPMECAEQFYQLQPIYYDIARNYWLWDNSLMNWKKTDKTEIMNYYDDALGYTGTTYSKQKAAIIESLERIGRRNAPKPIPLTWIQFNNTIYDLKEEMDIFPSYDYFATNTIPWKVGESEETPMLDTLFTEWVGEDYVQTLYEVLAYCMLPDYPLHRMFILNGGGRNGKSTFLNILTKFIGEHNVTTTELDDFIKRSFERASLYKKLVCVMGETNYSELKNTGVIKRLTGDDKMKFEFKGKDALEGYNYAKIIIATNNVPVSYDESDGFFSRMLIIDFPNQFNEKRNIMREIPEQEFENLARKSIRVLKGLLKDRSFHNEGTIEERRQRYIERSNELAKFIREKTERGFGVHIDKDEFRQEFLEWCRSNKYQAWSDKRVGSYMTRNYVERKIKTPDEEYPVRCYIGIKWRE